MKKILIMRGFRMSKIFLKQVYLLNWYGFVDKNMPLPVILISTKRHLLQELDLAEGLWLLTLDV